MSSLPSDDRFDEVGNAATNTLPPLGGDPVLLEYASECLTGKIVVLILGWSAMALKTPLSPTATRMANRSLAH